jgi:hypothetical protein
MSSNVQNDEVKVAVASAIVESTSEELAAAITGINQYARKLLVYLSIVTKHPPTPDEFFAAQVAWGDLTLCIGAGSVAKRVIDAGQNAMKNDSSSEPSQEPSKAENAEENNTPL